MRKQVKKLMLSAETLRNLDHGSLKNAAGGTAANTVCVNCNTQAATCTNTYLCSGCHPCD